MQESFSNVGSLSNLKSIVDRHSANKVLIVTGKNSFSLSGAQVKIKQILCNTEIIVFNDFQSNPRIEDVKKGIQLIKSENPDLIISIGGGSAIDMSKLIRILAPQGGDNYIDFIQNPNTILTKGIPLVAIPTTFGSGSEATHFAVVYIDKKKYSLAHSFVMPDYSILDAELCYSLPHYASASSGMDALSQAIESYWSVKSTDESKKYSLEAISLINNALYDAVLGDKKARATMLNAANLAGKAINITTTTAAHAISYPITMRYGVNHGHAVALTLGKFFIINSDVENNKVVDERGDEYLEFIMLQLYKILRCGNPYECCSSWYSLMKKIGLETKLEKLGVNSAFEVDYIINNINLQRLCNNPVKIDRSILSLILKDDSYCLNRE
jgi:alcohol dehydrogenase class IV